MATQVTIENGRKSEVFRLDGNAAAMVRAIARSCELANALPLQRTELHFSDSEVLPRYIPRPIDGERERLSS